MLLLDEKKLANIYKTKENQNKITVVTLEKFKIVNMQIISTFKEIKTTLKN